MKYAINLASHHPDLYAGAASLSGYFQPAQDPGTARLYAKSKTALSAATEVAFSNGQVTIPLAQVSDGDLHRYEAKENGTEIRFWLYQKPDGKIATVFDACQICGAVGFYKTANGVVCKNCGAPVNPQSVGSTGGCNPIPLKATQTADTVIIQEADIAAGGHLFEAK